MVKKVVKKAVKATGVKAVADELRDLKNWLFVFAEEYDIPSEAVKTLHKKMDKIGNLLRDL